MANGWFMFLSQCPGDIRELGNFGLFGQVSIEIQTGCQG